MRLSHLTFTGADDAVDPGELARLSAQAPLIEWGLLLSAEDEGRPRFPSRQWRAEFLRAAPLARRAAHVCGPGLLRGTTLPNPSERCQRLQLNFSVDDLEADAVQRWVDTWQRGGDGAPSVWITQHNAANAHLHERFVRPNDAPATAGPRHAVLFDASGGRGRVPGQWPRALPGCDCGYAGGLGPETIALQLPLIAAAAGDARPTWIDMEGALRVDDRLDLDRVRSVVESLRSAAAGAALLPGVRLVPRPAPETAS